MLSYTSQLVRKSLVVYQLKSGLGEWFTRIDPLPNVKHKKELRSLQKKNLLRAGCFALAECWNKKTSRGERFDGIEAQHVLEKVFSFVMTLQFYIVRQHRRKNTSLERRGLQSLEIENDNSRIERYGNILSNRTLESLRWFFLLFAPFSFHLSLRRESMFFIPLAALQLPHALPNCNETAKYALQLLRPRL